MCFASGGFIYTTRHGNIGRFLNHSCCPNLCTKDVMYDHNDKSLPYKMLFALKDIILGRDVSYDYGDIPYLGINPKGGLKT